jgi:predicted ester cyclase
LVSFVYPNSLGQLYEVFTAFTDLKIEPTSVLFADNHIIFEVIMRGTNDGPLEGEIPATGRSVELNMIFVTRVTDDGLIEEDRTYYDTAKFMKQLGFIE